MTKRKRTNNDRLKPTPLRTGVGWEPRYSVRVGSSCSTSGRNFGTKTGIAANKEATETRSLIGKLKSSLRKSYGLHHAYRHINLFLLQAVLVILPTCSFCRIHLQAKISFCEIGSARNNLMRYKS
jgi:hypothetical protein